MTGQPNILMFSPGFPKDLALFTCGLAAVGARVYGVGDQSPAALPEDVRACLSGYVQVRGLWDPEAVIAAVRGQMHGVELDAIECLWEPGLEVVAQMRETFGIRGMGVEHTRQFRDKERMKQVLDEAGIRTPRHARANSIQECRSAAEQIGYPLIIKPIDGAGSADTYRVDEPSELDRTLAKVGHVAELSVEEFIEGEEFTFDTICADGNELFHNVSWYRPKPLLMRQNPWISPISITLRDPSVPEIQAGVDLGRSVLRALEFQTGFTHMEWFRTPAGEVVFGEIGARAPGGRLVHAMNYSCDIDLFMGWAEAVCYGRLTQDTTKRHNVGVIFKRAEGDGKIQRIEGLPSLFAHYGEHIAHVDLVRVGAPRRDYRQVVEGDGWVVVRHPDFETTVEIANHVATDLQMFAS